MLTRFLDKRVLKLNSGRSQNEFIVYLGDEDIQLLRFEEDTIKWLKEDSLKLFNPLSTFIRSQ